MPPLARILVPAIVLLGPTACLKPNPLVQELADEAYGDGDTGTDDTCEPPLELEPECGVCLMASCCTSLGPCGDDPICVCMADCLFMGSTDSQCRGECNAKPTDAEPLAPLTSCAMNDCPDCFVL